MPQLCPRVRGETDGRPSSPPQLCPRVRGGADTTKLRYYNEKQTTKQTNQTKTKQTKHHKTQNKQNGTKSNGKQKAKTWTEKHHMFCIAIILKLLHQDTSVALVWLYQFQFVSVSFVLQKVRHQESCRISWVVSVCCAFIILYYDFTGSVLEFYFEL